MFKLLKVYTSAIQGHVPAEMVWAFSAYIDFTYLVCRNIINVDMLDAIDQTIEKFHHYRLIFQEVGVWTHTARRQALSLPRQHSMVHYRAHIENFGAPNGLCSSITESKHIAAVKKPWRCSSKYNAMKQMLKINKRNDKLEAAHQDFKARGMLDGSCRADAASNYFPMYQSSEGEGQSVGVEDGGALRTHKGHPPGGEIDHAHEQRDLESDGVGGRAEGEDDSEDEGAGAADEPEENCRPVDGPPIHNEVTLAQDPGT